MPAKPRPKPARCTVAEPLEPVIDKQGSGLSDGQRFGVTRLAGPHARERRAGCQPNRLDLDPDPTRVDSGRPRETTMRNLLRRLVFLGTLAAAGGGGRADDILGRPGIRRPDLHGEPDDPQFRRRRLQRPGLVGRHPRRHLAGLQRRLLPRPLRDPRARPIPRPRQRWASPTPSRRPAR